MSDPISGFDAWTRMQRAANATTAYWAGKRTVPIVARPGNTLEFQLGHTGWFAYLIMTTQSGARVMQDAWPALERNGFAHCDQAALSLLNHGEYSAGCATIKLPPGLPEDAIDEYIRNYRALFGDEDTDPRAATAPRSARHCHMDGHVFVDTGMLRSWCRWCEAEAEWSRTQGCYILRSEFKDRRYDS
jgi:hypothetical protein